jgi:hypothetical protein
VSDNRNISGRTWVGISTKSKNIVWVVGIITVAVILRLALIAQSWPLLDSDEGTMGLMAMHIAYRGEFPVFFYGQAYMGATEAYLGAFFFHLFGVSAFSLRLGLIVIYVIFMVAMYALTRLLYGPSLALVTLVALALGSNPVLTRELVAVGGDPEILMTGALLMALASWLALTWNPQVPQQHRWRRILLYGAWGLVAGFSLYSHELGAPFIALGAVMLLVFCWRELLGWAAVCMVGGALIGLSPLIYYNLTLATGKSTWFYIVNAVSAANAPVQIWQQLKGALLISLPTATGANPLCAISSVHLVRLNSLNGIHCTLVHTGWSLGWLCLCLIAALSACGAIWQLWRYHRQEWSFEKRQETVRQWGRLSLLVAASGTLFLYILSPNAFVYPVATSRYLIGLLIATPALLYPLWTGLSVLKPFLLALSSRFTLSPFIERGSTAIGRVILGLVIAILAFGTFSTFSGIPSAPKVNATDNVYDTQYTIQHLDMPATQALNQQESDLIRRLLHMNERYIYSDYWTCDRLIFQSREQILCSVVNNELQPGIDRYALYGNEVHAAQNAAYVLLLHSQADEKFSGEIHAHASTMHYQVFVIDGYAVYAPVNKRE